MVMVITEMAHSEVVVEGMVVWVVEAVMVAGLQLCAKSVSSLVMMQAYVTSETPSLLHLLNLMVTLNLLLGILGSIRL